MRAFRIGLMLGTKDTDYPRAIRLGVENTLSEAGHTLVNIADLIPYHTHAHCEEYLRASFELASRINLDATIVPAGVLNGYFDGNEQLARELISMMDPAHTLVLERNIEGYRCVTKDGRPGMRACMRHLIEDLAFKRIAFISGPITSVGARERETVYFEEMAAHNLEVGEGMFARGQFSGECADVVEQILDLQPEAIVCAADMIAFTVYHVMHERRLAVGSDIAVTGFDDHPNAAHVDPPLTTVHMTAYDFGCMAAREALRLCEQTPQQEFVLTSSFVVRNSCGEQRTHNVDRFRKLITQKPLPKAQLVDLIVDATLSMATSAVNASFRKDALSFVETVWQAYNNHRENLSTDDMLFSSRDLALLFTPEYREYVSLEGFHTICIDLLEALLAESPERDVPWVINQISYLHLVIARMLNDSAKSDTLAVNLREWQTFQLAEDSLIEDISSQEVYQHLLSELQTFGVQTAGLFLTSEPVRVTGSSSIGLSDGLLFAGSLDNGKVHIPKEAPTLTLQQVREYLPAVYMKSHLCTIEPIMAGTELLGFLAMNPGRLNDNRQLMIALNMGLALKHLRMLETEHEMNSILNANSLLLSRQSRHDEMSGLLNRRGLYDGIKQLVSENSNTLTCMLYLDLDGLKHINDSLGHDVGDSAIRATAMVLAEILPERGLAARMGGDEFVIVVQVEHEDQAQELIAQIQEGIRAFNEKNELPCPLSVSCGSACFVDDGTTESVHQAMVLADERMYQAKQLARTRSQTKHG